MRRGIGATIGWLLAGAVLGAVALVAVRLAWLPPEPVTHYHANWALFVDGQRLDLASERYMEDVAQCRADPTQMAPEDRVHMHNMDPDVVHVHDDGATWGHLLANLGFGVGDDYLFTDTGQRYLSDAQRRLKFVLNGREVPSIRNLQIEDRDRLLISYGPEPVEEVIRTLFPRVASSAAEHNTRPDPATCSGPAEHTFQHRLQRAVWR